MSVDLESRAMLSRPGTLLLTSNAPYREDLIGAGGRVAVRPDGYRVFYGRHGRRLLYVDPQGQALHECEWATGADGETRLLRARIWLDWDQWIGLVPGGLLNSTTVDLSTRPGWQRLRADDLRQMAARAVGVPFSEMRFFYTDEDLRIDSRGQATIRHRKDAFYLLPDGGFDQARFMACMGAMHWAAIDFLPVVELFQSLLPGTGSAVLELIRELYDDQQSSIPRPLRYRGIPTYPSEAAYGLFSGFFTPSSSSGQPPIALFMDQPRSHEVTWLPAATPLRRVSDPATGLCLTFRGQEMLKVTGRDDAAGLSYTPPDRAGRLINGRAFHVESDTLCLTDGTSTRRIPINPAWGPLVTNRTAPTPSSTPTLSSSASSWRSLFVGGAPEVKPAEAFGAVLLYPDDDQEISPLASQPFVADYVRDLFEQEPGRWPMVDRGRSVLIRNFDAALSTLITLDRPRAVRVLYYAAAFAQRQAQRVASEAARQQRHDCLAMVQFQPGASTHERLFQERYDVIYDWCAGETGVDALSESALIDRVVRCLNPGGVGCVVIAGAMSAVNRQVGVRVVEAIPVNALPTFRMHQTILPRARLKDGLTLCLLVKS